MRFLLAIWISKLTIILCKIIRKKASATPGGMALKICPFILEELSGQVKHETIAVCGTNGKTTTNNLLYSILKSKGFEVVCNNVGANMMTGIVTAYIKHCSFFGKLHADYACIEIDEASAVKIYDYIKPDYMVITNLFRDQLDRYGEIDITIELLKQAIAKTPDTILILNGDDPLVAGFKHELSSVEEFDQKLEQNRFFFGVNEDVGAVVEETKEGRFCTFCHSELQYHYYHYSQLGDYYCGECGFARPELDFSATEVKQEHGLEFKLNALDICVNYRGFYNIYNILAACSAASLLGMDMEHVNEVLSNYQPQIGRMESFVVDGIPVILNLSKNPAGFNQAISAMLIDKRKKDVVVVIHDNAQDGKDISWIWDVSFERMVREDFLHFTASGIRAEDVFVRMKYAEIATENILFKKNIGQAVKETLKNKNEVVYVLVNYTPLFETQKILKQLSGLKKPRKQRKNKDN